MEHATVISLHFRTQLHSLQRSNYVYTPYSSTSRDEYVAKSKIIEK